MTPWPLSLLLMPVLLPWVALPSSLYLSPLLGFSFTQAYPSLVATPFTCVSSPWLPLPSLLCIPSLVATPSMLVPPFPLNVFAHPCASPPWFLCLFCLSPFPFGVSLHPCCIPSLVTTPFTLVYSFPMFHCPPSHFFLVYVDTRHAYFSVQLLVYSSCEGIHR